MKKILMSILLTVLSFGLLAKSDFSDSTKVSKILHDDDIPRYTPFLTMFYFDDNGTKNWRMSFSMLVGKGEKIYFTPSTDINCGGKNCLESYVVSVETPTSGVLLDTWLDDNFAGSTLKRLNVTYNSEPGVKYELCTFTVDVTNRNPKKSRYKLEIGTHPKHPKDLKFIHEGGTVHWPGGN